MQSILQYRRIGRTLAAQGQRYSTLIAVEDSSPPLERTLREKVDNAQSDERDRSTQEYTERTDGSGHDQQLSNESGARGERYRIPGIEVQTQKRVKDLEMDEMEKIFIVKFESEGDEQNPKNWSVARKWAAMGTVGTTGFLVGWASAIDSGATIQAQNAFGVSDVTESLATGLYLIGFAFGSLVAGPFSETVGRNPIYVGSLTLFMVFVMASGLAPNIGAQLVFRLLAGFFGCTPLTTFGGSMADMFEPLDRTYVFPVCASLSFLGPFLAPTVGAYIGQSSLVSWRWCEWITLIMAGLITVCIALFVPETYAPVILKWKAEHLRRITGDNRFLAEIETKGVSLPRKLVKNAGRPFTMLFREIMVALFTIYLVVVYIVLFGFLTGYTFIYGEVYGFSQGSVGLAFVGMNVGFLVAFAIVPVIYQQYAGKLRRCQEEGKEKLEPEQRLWYAMLGAPCLPISLFWMGWTAYPNISYWSSLVASVMFGFSVQGIFISSYQYLIDSFELYAASALVTATFLRYLAAGAISVVSIPMYKNLGVHWTLTLLGCLGLVMAPVPYIFYWYGHEIRKKYSPNARS